MLFRSATWHINVLQTSELLSAQLQSLKINLALTLHIGLLLFLPFEYLLNPHFHSLIVLDPFYKIIIVLTFAVYEV